MHRLSPEQQDLALSALRLAHALSCRLWPTVRSRLSSDDCDGAAQLGLVKAALHYDPEEKRPFSAYASRAIVCTIIEAYRKGGTISLPPLRKNPSLLAPRDAARMAMTLDEIHDCAEEPDPEPGSLLEYLDLLPGRQGLVIRLMELEDLPSLKVAAAIGTTQKKVLRMWKQGLVKLREMVEGVV